MLLRREITFEGNDFATAEERALAEQAAWYLGEVFIRAKGGKWFYAPPKSGPDQVTAGQPHVRQLPPDADMARPLAAIQVTLDSTRGTPLRVQLDRYGQLSRL